MLVPTLCVCVCVCVCVRERERVAFNRREVIGLHLYMFHLQFVVFRLMLNIKCSWSFST